MTQDVLCAVADGVATVTINRPDKRNALNASVLEGLTRTLGDLEEDARVRVIVMRGAGTAFCSGMDLREMGARQAGGDDPESPVVEIFQRIEQSRHPSIAMIQGDAYAGGCELALHCDLRVASDVARFAMPLARLGLIVPFPLGRKLIEIIGPAYTRQILLTGRPVDAGRAREMGMVHEVVTPAELEAVTYRLAREIAGNAPLALRGMKLTIQRATASAETIDRGDLDDLVRRARRSEDAREGVRAMLEKRPPAFRGA